MNQDFVDRLYVLCGEPPRKHPYAGNHPEGPLAWRVFVERRDAWQKWFAENHVPDEAYLETFDGIMRQRVEQGSTSLDPPKEDSPAAPPSSNAELIERDLQMCGVAYTIDGKRVDPQLVVRHERRSDDETPRD